MRRFAPPYKITFLSLAVIAALPVTNNAIASNFSGITLSNSVLTFPEVSVQLPQAPDFTDTTGFETHNQPVVVDWGTEKSASWSEAEFLRVVQNAKEGINFSYTSPVGSGLFNKPASEMLVIDSQSFIVDTQGKSLRFYKDCDVARAITVQLKQGAGLIFENVDDFQIFSSDNFSLFSQSKNSSLVLNANNVWLQNSTPSINSSTISNNWILNTPLNSETVFHVKENFVAWLDIGGKEVSPEMNLIKSNNLDIQAKNVFVHVENKENQKINAVAFYAYPDLSKFGTEDSPIDTFYISGVQTGFFADGPVQLFANRLIMELDSEHCGDDYSKAGFGFNLQRASNVNVDQLYISGAHTGIRIASPNQVTFNAEDGIYIDSGTAKDGSGKSYGIHLLEDNSNKLEVAAGNFFVKNATSGILVDANGSSRLKLTAKNLVIQDQNAQGTEAISVNKSFAEITSDFVLLDGYEVGLKVSRPQDLEKPYQRANVNLSAIDQISMLNVDKGVDVTDSKLEIETGGFSVLAKENTSTDTVGIQAERNAELRVTANNRLNLQKVKTGFALDSSSLNLNAKQMNITTEDQGKSFSLSNASNAMINVYENAAISGDIQVEDSMLTISVQDGGSIFSKGSLVVLGSDADLNILNPQGSRTEILGNINAASGGSLKIEASGNSLISSESIVAQNGQIDMTLNSGSETLKGIYGVRGALIAGDGSEGLGTSVINLTLSGESNSFIGTSKITESTSENGPSTELNRINLTLENGSSWEVQDLEGQNNYVTELVLQKGVLNLRYGEDGTTFKTVDVDTLSGEAGLILFNAELSDLEINDRLEIQTAKEGTHRVHVEVASGKEPTKEQEGYLIRIVNDEGALFVADNNQLEHGVFFKDYLIKSRLNENNEIEWYLALEGQKDPNPEPELTPTAEAVVAMAGMGAQTTLYQNQLSDVRKRLGEVRQGIEEGVWVSVSTQKDRVSGFSSTAFEQDAYRFNFGFDHSIGQWLVGANIKAITANQKTKDTNFNADGDAHSEGINLYATWRNDFGYYTDFVLSADRYHQNINTRMLNGVKVEGGYHNVGMGISVEGGRKFFLDQNDGWFIEPQTQISYYWLRGDNFSMSNGMTVRQDDFESLMGRLGVVVGRDWRDEQRNHQGQMYARLGVNHEFLGDQVVKVNDVYFNDDLLGTRLYYGFGGEWIPTDNLKVFGHFEREKGAGYTKEFEFSVGMKYMF